MNLVTIEQVRTHCHLDPGDVSQDAMLTIYADAAEAACAKRANRALFKDAAALNTAIDAVPAAINAARATYDAAVEAANALTDTRARDTALLVAQRKFDNVDLEQFRNIVGIVATNDIIGAVLITTAHYFKNREEVITGQGAAAVQIPEGAAAIMDRYFYAGE